MHVLLMTFIFLRLSDIQNGKAGARKDFIYPHFQVRKILSGLTRKVWKVYYCRSQVLTTKKMMSRGCTLTMATAVIVSSESSLLLARREVMKWTRPSSFCFLLASRVWPLCFLYSWMIGTRRPSRCGLRRCSPASTPGKFMYRYRIQPFLGNKLKESTQTNTTLASEMRTISHRYMSWVYT